MSSLARSRLPGVPLLAMTLVLTLILVPSFLGPGAPLGVAAGALVQGAPSNCVAVGANWTSCDDAFASDDAYAFANGTRGPDQFARPEADVFAINWEDSGGDSVHFEEVDETTPDDDTTYTQTAVNPANGDDIEFNLSDVQDPQMSTGHILRYRYRNAVFEGGSSQLDLRVELREGNTVLASWTHTDVRNQSYVTRTQALSVAQADSIGNYSNLQIRLDVTFFPGSQSRQLRVTWAEFAVPGIPLPGPSDTAWRAFGLGLGPSDTVDSVEVGVEWFRISDAPLLNVTVSWDGGSSWAANQTATNKSVDDDTVEWLNFTSATAWEPTDLSDTNFLVRVGTNTSGARLDFVTVRVNYGDVILDLTLSTSALVADPGDQITLNATVLNLGSGPGGNLLIEASVDTNASYLSSLPAGTFDAAARTIRWVVASLPAGAMTNVEWTIRVNVGTPDAASVTSRARVEGEDSGGQPVPSDEDSSVATVQSPVFSPILRLDNAAAGRGEEVGATLYHNNTGGGTAKFAWLNWSLGGHYELVSLSPPFTPTMTSEGFALALADVTPGLHSITARLRVLRGLQDGLPLGLTVNWAATDGNGNPLSQSELDASVRLLAPVLSLGLQASSEQVEAGSTVQLTVTIQNAGGAPGTGWLNLTLPPGFRYLADDGTLAVEETDGAVSWRVTSIPAGDRMVLGIEIQALGEARLETLRLALDYTEGRGSPPVATFSNSLSIEVVGAAFPWAWLGVALAVVAAGGLLAFLLIQRRLREFNIDEVFVMSHSGILASHLSRTLTPDKDNDLLAGMLTTVQDFVTDAFSSREDAPVRRLEFGRYNILMGKGVSHWVAVIYRGDDRGSLEPRVTRLSEQIDLEFGDVLESWNGEMSAVKGIRHLFQHLWADEGFSLRGLGGLLGRLRGLWPQRGETQGSGPGDSEEEETQDPTVAQLLKR